MKRWTGIGSVVLLSLAVGAGCPPRTDMRYVENGVIKLGVDLLRGGTITYLADAGNLDVNLVNSADLGRMIQQSYYSGPQPFGTPNPSWPGWPWNPVGAGDSYGNASPVLGYSNDGSVLYVESMPMQWALDGVACECTFEQWLSLDGNVVEAHFKLTNARSDTAAYGGFHQELPAVYTTDRFHRLFTYVGGAPFTGAALTQVINSGPPWAYFDATEKWAALVQGNDWGLGVYNPGAQQFVGGFHGSPGDGDPSGGSTGYLSPLRTEAIEWNTVYEYDARFVVGYLDDIRAYVYQHRP